MGILVGNVKDDSFGVGGIFSGVEDGAPVGVMLSISESNDAGVCAASAVHVAGSSICCPCLFPSRVGAAVLHPTRKKTTIVNSPKFLFI